ncbi:hypothetical protein A1O1_04067 [Capronia coronata CBS 617.96]|uniref:Uncharacterized protein n=1 Tax=Capronia coronata CBS 617.96 TaxID=1182541 RepID=W9YMR7_9EURO|nr:uncharacterized protein A1O1_04067 [Capronia coronata CBS 617.96]EXJ90960.1 hypothetical protein A1O1_04067 [Capronia coronata CBS 617.96]
MSVASSHGSTYAETIERQHHFTIDEEMWHPKKLLGTVLPLDLSNESHRRDSASTHNYDLHSDSHSRSSSTLATDPSENEAELDLKTPTVVARLDPSRTTASQEDLAHNNADHSIPRGPMEQLLQPLLRKVAEAERNRPTIMAEDYVRLQRQVEKLEAEKRTWAERYEAYFIVRDQDLTNLLKVRELLAQERREHTAIRELREEDLANVFMLREKLAQAIWSKSRRLTDQTQSQSQSQHQHPSSQPTPFAAASARQSRTEGDDLWRAAKAAAMEHRILELEAANEALRAQMKNNAQTQTQTQTTSASTGGMADGGIGTGSAAGAGSGSGSDSNAAILMRRETMFKDSLRHRKETALWIQLLRSEKKVWQKKVVALEDRNLQLSKMVVRAQRCLTDVAMGYLASIITDKPPM